MPKWTKILIIFLPIVILAICFGAFFFTYNYVNSLKGDLVGLEGNGKLISDDSNLKDSGINGKDISIDTNYNPYYTFLNSDEKKLYKQMYANILKRKTTFVPIVNIETDRIQTIIESVTNDHPEIFWIDNTFSYKYTSDNICKQITLSFNDLVNDYENNKNLFDNGANSIINAASKLSTDYEKEIYVHNALLGKITYDSNSSYNQTAYSALVNGRTVCAGYAKSFQYIMNKLGIPTYYVVGTAEGEAHAWNIVKLADGYYNVDLTWNDVYTNHYTYFNLTDSKFSSSHTRSSLSSKLPSCTATGYSYNSSSKNSNNSNKANNSNNTPSYSNNDNNTKATEDNTNNTNENIYIDENGVSEDEEENENSETEDNSNDMPSDTNNRPPVRRN